MNKFQSHTFLSNDTSTKWLSILFLCLTNNLFGSIHQFSFLYKAQSQTHFSVDISANWKRMCFFFIFFFNFLNNEPDIHLQVWPTLVKTVGIIAIKWRVNVIGVGMLDGVVGKNGLEMDVMVPLVGQIDMNVYWIQVKIFFLINNVIKLV